MKKKVLVAAFIVILLAAVLVAVIRLANNKEAKLPVSKGNTAVEISSNAACAAITVAKLNDIMGFKVDTSVVKPTSNEGANCDFRVGKGTPTAGITDTATLILGKKRYMPLKSDYRTAIDIPNTTDPEAFIVPAANGTAMAFQRKGDWFVGVTLFSKTPYTNLQIKSLLTHVLDQI